MKFLDLLRMSSGNLWKRKVRTILTVLGVVIGVASIVVMLSLGLGLKRTMMEQYESYGSLTQITVNQPWNSDNEEEMRLDDELVQEISAMDHVDSVWPTLSLSAIAKYGGYEGYLQINARPKEAFAEMNIDVGDGRLPGQDDELTFFYGCEVLQNFYDSHGGSGYWETGVLPDIDLMNDPIFIIFDTNAYYSAGGTDENGQPIPAPKKYLIPACGVEATNENGWSQYSWYTQCDIDLLIPELKKIFKNKVIPGQPSTKTGKPYKEIFYNELYVNVDSMDHVMEVQNRLTELGYEAYSNAEWVESEQKTMGTIQLVLGGIGAVSLFVAAIGITNTMMMSIYERTKEIGVMKVLGCDMRSIQALFLIEAAYIGLIGGLVGLGASYGISAIINRAVAASGNTMEGLSYSPPWLAMASVVFAVIIGMVAGFFPSRRAMKLSPLAAIRNE